jgi:hypothetical protein
MMLQLERLNILTLGHLMNSDYRFVRLMTSVTFKTDIGLEQR